MLKYKSGDKVTHKLGIEMIVKTTCPVEVEEDKKTFYDCVYLQNQVLTDKFVEESELL